MPPLGDAVTGAAVAAAADGELPPGLSRARDDARNVGRVRHPDDDGWPAINPADEDGARLVVAGVARRDHPTVEGGAQVRDGEGGRAERKGNFSHTTSVLSPCGLVSKQNNI